MVGKKGVLRIAEASIAVIIVLGVILVVSANKQERVGTDLADLIPPILDEIARDVNLRDLIFLDEAGAIAGMNLLIENELGSTIGHRVIICQNINEFCGGIENYPSDADGDIYSEERVISTRLDSNSYGPKKIKIYLWRIQS